MTVMLQSLNALTSMGIKGAQLFAGWSQTWQ